MIGKFRLVNKVQSICLETRCKFGGCAMILCLAILQSCGVFRSDRFARVDDGNQVEKPLLGLDDSVFVELLQRMPEMSVISAFNALDSIGYGPDAISDGPSLVDYHNLMNRGVAIYYVNYDRQFSMHLLLRTVQAAEMYADLNSFRDFGILCVEVEQSGPAKVRRSELPDGATVSGSGFQIFENCREKAQDYR